MSTGEDGTDATRFRVRLANEMDRAQWLALRRSLWPDLGDADHQREMRRLLDDSNGCVVMMLIDDEGGLAGFAEASRRFGFNRFAPGAVALLDGLKLTDDLPANAEEKLLQSLIRWAAARGCQSLVYLAGSKGQAIRPVAVPDSRELQSVALRAYSIDIRSTAPSSAGDTMVAEPAQMAAPYMPAAGASEELVLPQRVPTEEPVNASWRSWIPPVFVGAIGLSSFPRTDIWSGSVMAGVLMPLVDAAVVIYFIYLILSHRYARNTRRSDRDLAQLMPDKSELRVTSAGDSRDTPETESQQDGQCGPR